MGNQFWDSRKGRRIIAQAENILGNILFALVLKLFLLPAELVTSGATGIAIAAHELMGLSVSGTLLALNVIMLAIGWALLGKAFALSTLLSTFLGPIALAFWEHLLGSYTITEDLFLCTIFSGLGIGLSLGIVLRAGSSTGGMDIPPLVLKRYFGIPVSLSFYVLDILVLMLQSVVYSPERILYGIVVVILSTMVMDRMLLLGTTRTEVKVISAHSQKIRAAILAEVERGVTMLHGETGYTNRQTEIVLSVIYNRELPKLERIIHEIDPESFLIINRISEVKGLGFTSETE